MYVYKETQTGIWTVGFYPPSGRFYAESDYTSTNSAAGRVHYLNGGVDPELFGQVVQHVCDLLNDTNSLLIDLSKRLGHDQN